MPPPAADGSKTYHHLSPFHLSSVTPIHAIMYPPIHRLRSASKRKSLPPRVPLRKKRKKARTRKGDRAGRRALRRRMTRRRRRKRRSLVIKRRKRRLKPRQELGASYQRKQR